MLVVNESDITGLDAFNELALESTTEAAGKDDNHHSDLSLEEQEIQNPTQEANILENEYNNYLDRGLGSDFGDIGGNVSHFIDNF